MQQVHHGPEGDHSLLYESQIFEHYHSQLFTDPLLSYAGSLLYRAYQLFPQNPALITTAKTVTYEECFARSCDVRTKLIAAGLQPRDKVLLYVENSIEFYIFYFAIWQAGAIIVPVNTFLHQKELAYIINESKPTIICASTSLTATISQMVTNKIIPDSIPVITEACIDWLSTPAQLLENIGENTPVATLGIDELCLLLYTSGTTGNPKGVMLSSRNVLTNTLQAFARFKSYPHMTARERFFCVLPLFHSFAQNTCIWLPFLSGSAVIIVKKIERKLILEGLAHKPTIFLGFPALYGLLCMLKKAPLDSIKIFVSGADMLPDKIRMAFSLIYGRKICSGYGLTEASPVVAINHYNADQASNIVGNPMPGMIYEIRDESNNIVSENSVGSLWIKGDNIMMGYYQDPEATKLVLQDGWLNTGDLAHVVLGANTIAITGRSKDLIIHKGFNIYPQEIENILLRHPAVIKAAVVGKDEEASGQIPVAYVAVKTREQGLENNLHEWCAHNLAAYKIPRKFICLDDLPMNSTGKIDKKQLSNLTHQ